MTKSHEALLKKYLQLPGQLENAIAGLSESALDMKHGEGWSIRAYLHHTVEGEAMWQLFLRGIVGNNGSEFPIRWYFSISQDEWAKHWLYEKRPIEPSLNLFKANINNLVAFLQLLPPEVWNNYGRVTWPGEKDETRLTVRDILLIHIGHMTQHVADICAIRKENAC
jgi:hypothetical protein